MKEASADECRDPATRPFNYGDLDEVVDVDKECFEPLLRYDRRVFESIIELGDRVVFYVAECDGRIIGYALAVVEDNECHLYSIAVRAKYRRRGIGTSLLMETIEACKRRGCSRMILEVAVDNTEAIGFYLKHRFRIKGIIPGYYYGVKDAFLMEKLVK